MKIILFLLSSIIFSACGYDERSKKKPPKITSICNSKLYVETYNVFAEGGAIGGSMESDYITDSSNFRIYIGTYDYADGGYSYSCKGDSIMIQEFRGRAHGHITSKEIVYNIKDLKKEKKFE